MSTLLIIRDVLAILKSFLYRNFFAYFHVSEVGERWAMFNNLMGYFALCVGLIYVTKPWGLTKWNRNVVKNRRRLRELAFRKLEDVLTKANADQQYGWRRITSLSFSELREQLQNETITAADTVEAFRWKALECQKKYNCVIEFVNEAPGLAQSLDEKYKGQTKPPLFGIPFSVKENLCLIGYECSRALAKELEWPAREEFSVVKHLRTLGAVPLVRTTVPQSMLSYTCSSIAFGTTLNPYDSSRTPGGSSGGETALIASGGCPFGIGSDVGGSMRIPASFCGITTIKPTSGRLRATGARHGVPGISKLAWSCGFFSADVSTQVTLLTLTLVAEYFQTVPQCVPLIFHDRKNEETPNLRIGYYVEDGWFPSVPATKKAVLKAKAILEAIGHQLVPVSIPDPERAVRLILKCICPDNGAYWLENLKYEDVDPNLKMNQRLLSIPLWIRWLGSRVLALLDRKAGLVVGSYVHGLGDLRATFEDADAYVKEFFDYWKELELDAMIGTVMPFPAVPHDCPSKLSTAFFSTAIYNFLDIPAGVVRVGHVTEVDETEAKFYPHMESTKRCFSNPLHTLIRKAMLGSTGLPVCVQVMTLPYQEELCLRIMKAIEDGRE